MKVLVVDDSLINIKVASKILEREGCVVETAVSGFDAIEKVKENNYDLIFMDIMMPEMDGIETFKHLKEISGFSTPVITLTADAEVGAREKYLSLGFNGYLSKPININELREILKINVK